MPGKSGEVMWQERIEDYRVECDVRVVRVADASIVAAGSGKGALNKLDAIAKELVVVLKAGFPEEGRIVALAGLRNRSGTRQGEIVIDELGDKLMVCLVESKWFDVKERVDLSTVLDEKDLERAEIVKEGNVRQKLAAVEFIIIGGVSVGQPAEKRD